VSLLGRLEHALESLAEGSAAQIFGGRIDLVAVGQELFNAAVEQSRGGPGGPQAPEDYEVHLALDDFAALGNEAERLQREYGRSLWRRLRQARYAIAASPRVLVTVVDRMTPGRFEVRAAFSDRPPSCVLVRLGPARADYRVDLPAMIGRDPACAVSLDSPSVSRRHAQVVWDGNHFHVVDLGSKNGVLLNGAPVVSAPVEPGDVLVLGTERLRLQADDGSATPDGETQRL
jgi:FHA domain/FhaA, N-terminal domain